jgi:hypothetical protein
MSLGKSSLAIALIALSTAASAAPLQQIQVANMLYNQDATAIGVTATSVTVKFFAAGGATPCQTVTLPFQGVQTVLTGTGNACTAKVATIQVAPVASPTVGALYTAPATYTVTGTDYDIQLMIQQKDMIPFHHGYAATYFGPVFDTTNGLVATPGTAVIVSQSRLHYMSK